MRVASIDLPHLTLSIWLHKAAFVYISWRRERLRRTGKKAPHKRLSHYNALQSTPTEYPEARVERCVMIYSRGVE